VATPTARRTKGPGDDDCASDPLCCAPLSGAVLARGDAERLGQVLKALADPTRLQLMSLVLAAPGGEVCVGDLVPALRLSQPTVSHHLRVLHEAGLLRRDQRGSWVWYSVVDERLVEIRGLLG
jgi:ArsR family transcriptional regulator